MSGRQEKKFQGQENGRRSILNSTIWGFMDRQPLVFDIAKATKNGLGSWVGGEGNRQIDRHCTMGILGAQSQHT